MSTIGDRICELRTKRGMTQSELAEKIGETKQTIYKYEHGIVTNIPLPKIEAMARALGCTPGMLAGWDQTPPPEETDEFPEITMIARAGRKMPPERRADMMQMLKIAFPELFDGDAPDD